MFLVDTHDKLLATLTMHHVLQCCTTCCSAGGKWSKSLGGAHDSLAKSHCHNVIMSEDKFHQTLVNIYCILSYVLISQSWYKYLWT